MSKRRSRAWLRLHGSAESSLSRRLKSDDRSTSSRSRQLPQMAGKPAHSFGLCPDLHSKLAYLFGPVFVRDTTGCQAGVTGNMPSAIDAIKSETEQTDSIVRSSGELSRLGGTDGEAIQIIRKASEVLRNCIGTGSATPGTGNDNDLQFDDIFIEPDHFNRYFAGHVMIVHKGPHTMNYSRRL